MSDGSDGRALVHVLREPAAEADGALILVHGRGTDERDLLPLLDALDPERRLLGVCPGGPLTGIPPGGRHWYVVERVGYPDPDSFRTGFAALSGFLDAELERRGMDWNRTVLGGFSQGAVMAYALGLDPARPRTAGILALSGFVPTVAGWEPDLDGRRGLPVYMSHGALDPIISVEFGRAARGLLTDAGLDVVYREADSLGHSIDPRLLPEMAEWLSRTVSTGAGTSAGG